VHASGGVKHLGALSRARAARASVLASPPLAPLSIFATRRLRPRFPCGSPTSYARLRPAPPARSHAPAISSIGSGVVSSVLPSQVRNSRRGMRLGFNPCVSAAREPVPSFRRSPSGAIIGHMRAPALRREGCEHLARSSKSIRSSCANLTMRSSGPRGESIVFPDTPRARGRLTRRWMALDRSLARLLLAPARSSIAVQFR
jgi:hypothetical protein